ncbi:stress responsive A/B barrel domain-containing protein [Lophiotrema nucula]|uniref:Stress responsive A/B barrel domain-containing protein n=1 Tax=Lophiotrema nucula TaxID=690887 RepID=A0A6A5ZEE8_9PLEO|nr:stress responsive A/B barrel domain-containing protein [Lophiotrema nucula]
MIVPRRAYGWVVTLVLLLGLVAWCGPKCNPVAWVLDAFVPEPQVIPYISHIVLFQFKKGTNQVTIKEINSKLLALKKSCIHPGTHLPYIVSITGGKDISIESKQDGFTHAFILRFYSKEDRNYYVEKDPAHKQFKDAAASVIEKVQVLDFQEGVFY